MTTYVEFLGILTRACEQLRDAGLPDDEIKLFATRLLERASVTGLDEVVGRLDMLGRAVRSGEQQANELFAEFMQTIDRIGSIASRPEVLTSENPAPSVGPKHPGIKVHLADLDDQLWPILRRVSYAMSDAGIDDAEIEKYKSEMRGSHDPVGVSRRWIHVS
jgi:hypothetical protein